MSKLFLLRHAHAGWAQPGMRDAERPLDDAGRAEAIETGRLMQEAGHAAAVTLCSTAMRTRETLLGIKTGGAEAGREVFVDALYHGGVDDYLAAIGENGVDTPLLLIGHNPVMHDLAQFLCNSGEQDAMDRLHTGFPTSGLAVIRITGAPGALSSGSGFLEAFLKP